MVDNGNAGADDSRFSEVVSQLLIWMTRCPGGVLESCVGLYHHLPRESASPEVERREA